MNINETAKTIHGIAKSKGFWDTERNVGELLMLIVSELGEGLEAHRKDQFADASKKELLENANSPQAFKVVFEEHFKDKFEDEIADTVIRLFDLAEGLGIDLEWHMKNKMEYNKSRERLHGKAY